jgi:hypothetical protein
MNNKNTSIGQERLKSDTRQIAGFLMLVSTCTLIFPMADIASLIGPNGTTASEGIGLSALIASILVVMMGILGIVIGYLQVVHDYGHKHLTAFFLVFIQLSWMVRAWPRIGRSTSTVSASTNNHAFFLIVLFPFMTQPFITTLTSLGRGARSGAAFIPAEYDPSAADVKFVGAMGMMSILGHGFGTVGSLALGGFALYAFQVGKPEARPGSYYAGRLGFYSAALFLVGLAQFLLGAYIIANFGNGPLPFGPIAVAVFVVNFPEISVFCGLVNILLAFYGGIRAAGFLASKDDQSYSQLLLFGWLCNITLAIMVQVAYTPADAAAAAAPTATMVTSAIYAASAFMDFKLRSTPDASTYYYEVEGETQKEELAIMEASPDSAETSA